LLVLPLGDPDARRFLHQELFIDQSIERGFGVEVLGRHERGYVRGANRSFTDASDDIGHRRRVARIDGVAVAFVAPA
ncbi:MAG: hypothetical protein WBM47_16205, partial [Polyangiales bacterium]